MRLPFSAQLLEVEQTWIVTKLSGVTNKISSELTLLKKLELQKKSLMQNLLIGKLQVTAELKKAASQKPGTYQ